MDWCENRKKVSASDPLRLTYDNMNTSETSYTTTTGIVDNESTLMEENLKEVRVLYPLIFFYAVILIIGVIGNALVLIVYTFRYKRSPARVYILFLASIDCSICLFGLPYHLIDLTNPYTFTDAFTCKALTFVITTLFHMSIFGLIVIAIDRYLKICRPLSRMQIAYLGKRRACGAAALAAVLLSWPNLILYGPSEMETSVANVTGYACYFETKYLGTNYPLIYTVTTLCVCITSTIFLIISYSLICHQIYSRYQNMQPIGTQKLQLDDTSPTEEMSLKSFSIAGNNLNTSNAHIPFISRSCENIALQPEYCSEKHNAFADNLREVGAQHRKSNENIEDNYNGDLACSNPFTGLNQQDKNNEGQSESIQLRKKLHFNKRYVDNETLTLKESLLELNSSDEDEDECNEESEDGNGNSIQINKKQQNALKHGIKDMNTDIDVADVYNLKETDRNYLASEMVSLADRRLSAPSMPGSIYVHGASHLNYCNESSMCNLLNRSGSSVMVRIPNQSNQTIHSSLTNFSNKSCNSVNSFASSNDNKLKKNVKDRRQTEIKNKLNIPNGFPMCRPQKLKRRCSEQILPQMGLTKQCQRSASLSISVAHSLQVHHSDDCTKNGLRVHSSSNSVLQSNKTNMKVKPVTKKHSKITKIMLTVTLVFILSYSPALVVTIWSIVQPDLWDVITIHQTVACEFFLRFYLVNNVCNPFIYGFWDKRFVREIRYSFKRMARLFSDKCLCCFTNENKP